MYQDPYVESTLAIWSQGHYQLPLSVSDSSQQSKWDARRLVLWYQPLTNKLEPVSLQLSIIELGLLELDRTINIISYIQLIFRAASLVYMHIEERKDASGI